MRPFWNTWILFEKKNKREWSYIQNLSLVVLQNRTIILASNSFSTKNYKSLAQFDVFLND